MAVFDALLLADYYLRLHTAAEIAGTRRPNRARWSRARCCRLFVPLTAGYSYLLPILRTAHSDYASPFLPVTRTADRRSFLRAIADRSRRRPHVSGARRHAVL
jgi:hypothetical protein